GMDSSRRRVSRREGGVRRVPAAALRSCWLTSDRSTIPVVALPPTLCYLLRLPVRFKEASKRPPETLGPCLAHTRSASPVSCLYASRYFSVVFSTTSFGSSGAGGFLSQPVDSSQSRTNCLSYDGGFFPTTYWSAGQKREESGVSASSIQTIVPSARPNSNFVSAMMMPRVRAKSAAWP